MSTTETILLEKETQLNLMRRRSILVFLVVLIRVIVTSPSSSDNYDSPSFVISHESAEKLDKKWV
jgi:hypothetical protein